MRGFDPGALRARLGRLRQAARDGSWVTRRRVVVYSALLIAAWVLVLAWALTGRGVMDPLGRPLGTDFVSFWSVSAALLAGAPALAYHPAALAGWERALFEPGVPFYAWFYPPTALLLVAPLGLLPYLWSLALWLGGGLVVYLLVLRQILRDRTGMLAALAFPAVFVTLSHGQNAFLTTALFGGAMLSLEKRPWLAGVLIGALSFKPQLGLLIPLALIARGEGRAFAAAAAATLGLAALSALVFGLSPWAGFWTGAELARRTLEEGFVPFAKQQSVFAAVRLLGGGIAAAYAVQAAVSAAAAAAVVWAWRQPGALDLKAAALAAACLLAAPFVLDYDQLLLALPIAWMAERLRRDGGAPFEKTGLALAALLPLLARPAAVLFGLPLSPLIIGLLLALLLRRIAAAGRRDAVEGALLMGSA